MDPQRRRPCKFGPNCGKYTRGEDCGYLHDPNATNPNPYPSKPTNPNQGMGGGMMGAGTGGPGRGGKIPCKFGANCNRYAVGTCTFLHDDPNSTQVQNPNPSNPVQTGTGGPRRPPRDSNPTHEKTTGGSQLWQNFESQVCRNFHFNRCQNPEICRRLHKFAIDDSLTRTYLNSIQTTEPSSIDILDVNGQQFIVLRMGKILRTLSFVPDNPEQVVIPQEFKIESPNIIHSMNIEGPMIMYCSLSQSKTYTLNVINILTSQNFTVHNAYQKTVSGMAMLSDFNLITTSFDGVLKVWNLKADTNQLELNKQISERLRASIPGNSTPLLFCKVTEALGSKLLWIGTQDGRLLVWDLNTLNFNTISTSNYIQVWDIQIQTIPGPKGDVTVAMVLAWNEKNESAILYMSMADLQINIFEQQADPKNLICKFLFTKDLIFIARLKGQVIVRNVKTGERVGLMYFNRRLESIKYVEKMTSTQIKLKNVIMLEVGNNSLPAHQQASDNDFGKLAVFRCI